MKKIAFLLIVLIAASCSQDKSPELDSMKEANYIEEASHNASGNWDSSSADEDLEMEEQVPVPRTSKPPSPPSPYEKKIIRNASLTIEVENFNKSRLALEEFLNANKANIANESAKELSHRSQNQISIKVDPAFFFPLIKNIEGLAYEVKNKNISSQDVGAEYFDLETRLETKKAVVKRYREILNHAKNIEEILTVEEKIRRVVEEIESTQGRLKYLNHQVSLSTINLTMFETKELPTFAKAGFFGQLGDAFISGWVGLQQVVLVLARLWAFIAIFGLAAFIFFRKRKIA